MAVKKEGRQQSLPLAKAVQIAFKSIKVRLVRSLLVTSGIILAIAFLTYILLTNTFDQNVEKYGSTVLKEQLQRDGLRAADVNLKDKKIETNWMVSLALLISFVGITNAMLMSVTERFREIGTMKCLGALDSFIVKLFMLESTFQGIVGTLAGVIIGLVLSYTEGFLIYKAEVLSLIPALYVLKLVGLCFIAGTLLAIVGAVYPAMQAARMKPVDAMRSEV